MHALTAHKLIKTCELATVNVFSSFRKTKIEGTLCFFRVADKCLGLNVHCIMVFFIQQSLAGCELSYSSLDLASLRCRSAIRDITLGPVDNKIVNSDFISELDF